MKRNFRSTVLVILFYVTLAISTVSTAQAQDEGGCSNVTAAGKWGFTTAGTVFLASGPAPVVVVGSFKLDGPEILRGLKPEA